MCGKLNDDTLEMSLDFFEAFSIVEIFSIFEIDIVYTTMVFPIIIPFVINTILKSVLTFLIVNL